MFRRNGTTSQLETALAVLLQNQAQFLADLEAHREEDRQRFERIERQFQEIMSILRIHEEILRKLPDAIKEKIGFKQ
jgi:hypothetical protein